MSRGTVLLYGILSYFIGMGGLFSFVLYVGGWSFLPFHIDSRESGSLSSALLINLVLMLIFGLQHSIMARPAFKKILTKVIPPAAERSTYVLMSGIIFFMICYFWQPIAGTVWQVDNQILASAIMGIQIFGWTLMVASSFLINHFDLFGLQQVYLHFLGKPEPKPYFTDRLLYKVVRHPLQLGILIGIWFSATMTMTHLVLSIMMTAYIYIGLYFEERDLIKTLGQDYLDYKQRVPMLLPFPRKGIELQDLPAVS